jgi:uncharacterized membrane protein YtjA (UPF0391 family)
MLYYALIFLVVGLIAGALGVAGVAAVASQIAWVLFVIAIVLFILHLVSGRSRPVVERGPPRLTRAWLDPSHRRAYSSPYGELS